MRGLNALLLGSVLWAGWTHAEDPISVYRAEWDTWHKARLERLTAADGFLSLAGLYWLVEGENRFGAAGDNNIVFPDPAPAHIGVFTLAAGQVSLEVKTGVEVFREDPEKGQTPVRALDFPDLARPPTATTPGFWARVSARFSTAESWASSSSVADARLSTRTPGRVCSRVSPSGAWCACPCPLSTPM